MYHRKEENNHKILSLISELSIALRCCQKEEVFCENVTFSQFFILNSVSERKKLKLRDLHEILNVDKSTTTRLVDPLVRQGLITREKSREDARAINLRMTREGENVRSKVLDCLSRFTDEVQMEIPEERREEVYDSVKIFLSAMQKAFTSSC